MADDGLVSAGRIGRPHGLDGTFHVRRAAHPLPEGTQVFIGGVEYVVNRRAGTDSAPLIRVDGVADRDAAATLTGEQLMVAPPEASTSDSFAAQDLIGCEVDGTGTVAAVIEGKSCDVLELEDGTLIPVVDDAIKSVDLDARRIEVDRRFLGLA